MLNEHQYCDTSRLRFNRSSGKYLPRTAKQEEQILESLKYAPIDLEDLKYFREELEAKHPKIKWTPHPITKFTKKVFSYFSWFQWLKNLFRTRINQVVRELRAS